MPGSTWIHVHLPKALHNWRELAREIAIIVVGVFIALFFEQLVERWQWGRKIDAAEAGMRHELLWDDGPQFYQRAAMHPCVVAQLDKIRSAVDSDRSRTEVWTAIDGYWMFPVSYDSIAHEAAATSDVSSHIPQSTLEPYVLAYAVMQNANESGMAEAAEGGRLRALRRSGGRLSDDEARQVLNAVEQLRLDDRLMWNTAQWTLPQLKKIGHLDTRTTHFMMLAARRHYGRRVRDLPSNFPAGLSRFD